MHNPGLAMKLRRTELQLSQIDIRDRTNRTITQKLVSMLENNERQPLSLNVEQFGLLLGALQWGMNDFEKATGIQLPEPLKR